MKSSILAWTILSLGSFAAAGPVNATRKGDVQWVTEIAYVTDVIVTTTTVYIDTDATSTASAVVAKVYAEDLGQKYPHRYRTRPIRTGATTRTPIGTAIPPAATESEESIPVPTVPVQTVSNATVPSQTVPVPTVPSQTIPTPTVPIPTTFQTSVVPTYSAPVATSTPQATPSGDSESTTGQVYTGGDITYYEPNGGLGSCGSAIQNSEDVVALPVGMMDSVSMVSNGHPWCGKKVIIYFNGNEYPATVQDKCMGCKVNDIDLTKGLFDKVTQGKVDGRGYGQAKWAFAS